MTVISMHRQFGHLAAQCGFPNEPLKVLSSSYGFYIGTSNDQGPISKESVEFYHTRLKAKNALETCNWNQNFKP